MTATAVKTRSLWFNAGSPLPTDTELEGVGEMILFGELSRDEVSFFKMAQNRVHFTLVNGDQDAAAALDPPEE